MITSEEREKLIQQNSKYSKRIIDLDDQLKDGMPYSRMKAIRDRINMLEDIIFWNREILNKGIDNE